MQIINLFYLLILLVNVLIAGAIVFHMLYYKINRQVTYAMFLIFLVGALILMAFNINYFRSVDWYMIFSNLGF